MVDVGKSPDDLLCDANLRWPSQQAFVLDGPMKTDTFSILHSQNKRIFMVCGSIEHNDVLVTKAFQQLDLSQNGVPPPFGFSLSYFEYLDGDSARFPASVIDRPIRTSTNEIANGQ